MVGSPGGPFFDQAVIAILSRYGTSLRPLFFPSCPDFFGRYLIHDLNPILSQLWPNPGQMYFWAIFWGPHFGQKVGPFFGPPFFPDSAGHFFLYIFGIFLLYFLYALAKSWSGVLLGHFLEPHFWGQSLGPHFDRGHFPKLPAICFIAFLAAGALQHKAILDEAYIQEGENAEFTRKVTNSEVFGASLIEPFLSSCLASFGICDPALSVRWLGLLGALF